MSDKIDVADSNLEDPNGARSSIKVLMICDTLPPIEGGIENHVHNLVKQLGKRCKVYLLASRVPENMPAYQKCDNAEIYRVSTGRFSSLRVLATGLRLAKKNKVHIIHVHSLGQLSIIAGIIGKILSRPVVLTVHESQFIMKMRSNRSSMDMLLLYLLPMMLANTIIVPSAELRQYAARMVNQKRDIREICNGVDLSIFNPDIKGTLFRRKYGLRGVRVILCPRRITPKNGITYLVDAIPRVTKEEQKLRFVFAGPVRDQEYFSSIKKQIKEYELDPYVLFTRGILYSLMPKLYAASDIVVIPSLIEATSLAALEAMASGKPIVASAVGGLLEIVRHGMNGLLVRPKDSGGLARAIIHLLRNDRVAKRLGHNGQIIAQGFSWERVSQRVIDAYKFTIKQYRQPGSRRWQ